MDEKIRKLIEQHHAYYEVTPCYIVIDESHGTPAAKTRRIQCGFDVDVYGIKTSDDRGLPATSPDYALGRAVLQELAKTISSHSTDNCSARPSCSPRKIISRRVQSWKSGLPITGALINLPVLRRNKR